MFGMAPYKVCFATRILYGTSLAEMQLAYKMEAG